MGAVSRGSGIRGPGFDATQRSLAGLILGQLIITVLGALTVTSEYSTGMIRTSLTVQPRRGTLLAAKGVVFFLHGNVGNLQTWFVNTALYRQANYDLVMFDYRGFGKSTGRIESEAQLQADVLAVWQRVAPRYLGRHVIIFGRSLGTGLAATLAARVQPDLTMLASPYTSVAALAAEHYPWVPAGVLRYPLRTDAQLARVRTPVVLLHGDRDRLIPISHSQALQVVAPHARLVVVRGAGHGDLQEFEPYLQAVRSCLHDY